MLTKVFIFESLSARGRRNGTGAEGGSGVEAPPRRQTFENKTFCEQNFFSENKTFVKQNFFSEKQTFISQPFFPLTGIFAKKKIWWEIVQPIFSAYMFFWKYIRMLFRSPEIICLQLR